MRSASKHGYAKRGNTKPEYWVWNSMRQRCNNPKDRAYPRYGGRGIKVCERWRHFENFIADMGPRPANATVERRNNDGDYSPDNCIWATWSDQHHNKRVCSRNKSGVTGVLWRADRSLWQAEIMINRQRVFLGRFKAIEDAIAARRAAEAARRTA